MKRYQDIPRYRYDELVAMPTLAQGHDADLKHEEETDDGNRKIRLWLHRTSVADGEPFRHTVTVETSDRARGGVERQHLGPWRTLYRYDGDRTSSVIEEDR